jgi:AraC-like DNA-binding protein
MDLHIVPGVKANDVAEAHRLDVLIQDDHACKCMTYWVDEGRGHIFCLIDAPGKETVIEMHNRAHGLVPHKIIEVQTSLVESFLGRITDPEDAALNPNGLKLLTDTSFRILVLIRLPDPVLIRNYHGEKAGNELLYGLVGFVKEQLNKYGGVETQHEGAAIIASFISAAQAVQCAVAMQALPVKVAGDLEGLRVGVSAGEPVTGNPRLFGDAIRLAERIAFITKDNRAGLSAHVKELLFKENFKSNDDTILSLSSQDEVFLNQLFECLEKNWQDTEFNLDDYCQTMAMSKSRLYRKILALTGFSPNLLLKDFRLQKARELLKTKQASISGVSFQTGFSSPSYFTKCFKKKYGLLPMAYLEMLD